MYGKGVIMDAATFTRYRAKNTDPNFSGSTRAKSDKWQLIIERDVPNPDFIPKSEALDAEGNDTRTYRQKRRSRPEQRTMMYDGEAVTEAKAKEAARAWLDLENAKLARAEAASVSVPDYLDTFLTEWERNIEPSTLKGYKNLAKHIRAEFEGVALCDLTGKQVTTWVNKMHRKGLSQATQVKAFRLLNLVCKQAVKSDDLDANPCDKADAPKAPKPDPNPLTEKSRETLIGLLEGMEPTPLAVAAYLGIYMGLREAEICALQWQDVDFARELVAVHKAIGRAEGEKSTYIKGTKTDGSTRLLPIPAPLLEVLKARKAKMCDELAQAEMSLDDEEFGNLYVIGYVDGRYKNPNVLGKEWRGFAEAFDLMGTRGRLCTFHDTRHTFATVAVAAKIDVKSVASYLGHSNAAMTLNIYADADENAKRAAADVMGEAFGKAQG